MFRPRRGRGQTGALTLWLLPPSGGPAPARGAGVIPPAPPSRGERRRRRGARPPSSLLPPSGGRSGGGSRPWERRRPAGLARSANEGAGRRDAGAPRQFTDERGREEPRPGRRAPGQPPSRPPPFQGGGEKTEAARPRPGDSDVGEVPDALTLWLLPPSGGRSGGGSRPGVRRRPAGLARSANEGAGRRDAGAPRQFTDERGREEPRPGRRAPGQPPSRPPPFQGGGEGGGGAPPARRQRRRRGTRRPDSLAPPPFRGEVGRGSRPGVRRRPAGLTRSVKRIRVFGPPGRRDAGAPRQLTDERDREGLRPGHRTPGSTPLPTSPLPGGRREGGGVAPSHAFPVFTPPPPRGEETGARAGAGAAACAAAARPP